MGKNPKDVKLDKTVKVVEDLTEGVMEPNETTLILVSILLLFSLTFISCKSDDGSKSTTSSDNTWTKQLGTSYPGTLGNGVTTDSSGNIYVTGSTCGGSLV